MVKDTAFGIKESKKEMNPVLFKEKILRTKKVEDFAREFKLSISVNIDIPCQPIITIGQKNLTSLQCTAVSNRFIAAYEIARENLKKLGVECNDVLPIIKRTMEIVRTK